MRHEFERYCKDYKNIENYEMAAADNFIGWHCHHRLETHTPDGERRPVDISQKELKSSGMYYNRPPEELIFLTIREHNAFNKGKKRSEETRKKLSEAKKDRYTGENNPMYGKRHSEETKKRMREAHKGENNSMYGKRHSEESKKKMREAHKGKNIWIRGRHWYNNGKENKYCYECPEGFVSGRLKGETKPLLIFL